MDFGFFIIIVMVLYINFKKICIKKFILEFELKVNVIF